MCIYIHTNWEGRCNKLLPTIENVLTSLIPCGVLDVQAKDKDEDGLNWCYCRLNVIFQYPKPILFLTPYGIEEKTANSRLVVVV